MKNLNLKKNCPVCKKLQYFGTVSVLNYSSSRTPKSRLSIEKMRTRNCSKGYYGAISNNSLCRSCSQKNNVMKKRYKRQCSTCSNIIKYKTEKSMLLGESSRSSCKPCKNNPTSRGQHSPNYNPLAFKFIDKYGKEHGYNFQHTENGGEFHIKELGYWVDGYDKNKNTIIGYYEPFHKKQTERDEWRKQEIINLLGCKFIEIKEN